MNQFKCSKIIKTFKNLITNFFFTKNTPKCNVTAVFRRQNLPVRMSLNRDKIRNKAYTTVRHEDEEEGVILSLKRRSKERPNDCFPGFE